MNKIITVVAVTAMMSTAAFANTAVCKGCHGQNFEKKAMGKSKVVKDMTQDEIATALKGYKAGTYGGPMKGLMKGQVAKYSDEDLDVMAAEIKK